MKKSKKYLILILLGAIVGFLTSFLRHNFYLTKLFVSIKSIHFLFYIPLILFVFFLYILIHELGHLFYFVFSGIKIKALYVLTFILIKTNNKWKFLFKIKNLKLVGGIVVPIIPDITNDNEYEKIKNTFSKALIAGPITSIVYYLISFLTFILIWFYTDLPVLTSLLFFNVIVGLPMTLLIHFSSKLNTNNIFGDYVAYEKFKNEEYFSLVNIIQYYNFNYIQNDLTNNYLKEKLKQFFSKNKQDYSMFNLSLATYYLMYLIKDDDNNKIDDTFINFYNINNLTRSEYGLELAYLISAYYYSQNNVSKSYEIFNLIQINVNNKIDKEKQLLLKLEYEHLLNIANNKEMLYSKKDLILKEYDILEPLFDVNIELENMTKNFELKEYKTELICFI